MALKSLVLVSLLVAAKAASLTQAQLGGLIGDLLGLIRIQGTLYCTVNGRMGANGTATPVFPNAVVQLQCGRNVISSVKTNGSGIFSIVLDPLYFALSSLLTNCNLKVNTPLSTCNASLPDAGDLLQSPLQLVGNTVIGLLNVTNIIPAGFQVVG